LRANTPSGGRIFYFAGDVDRCYGRTHLPDLGDLLANAVKWAVFDKLPLRVEGPGYLDCKLYRHDKRMILHVINLSGCNQTPGYVEEIYPVGPITVSIKITDFVPERTLLKGSGIQANPELQGSWATICIGTVRDHEFIIME